MGQQDPAEAIRQLIAQCARPIEGGQRVNAASLISASNAASVIVVVGNGNFIAPAAPGGVGEQGASLAPRAGA